VDARERRLARNELLFRDLNERVEQIARSHGPDEHVYEFMCECSNIDCDLRLRLTLAEYEHARSDPAAFVVAHGHELPEIEDVVLRAPAYQLVRKFAEAAELAREHDPRE
jgi:hypothetical protein